MPHGPHTGRLTENRHHEPPHPAGRRRGRYPRIRPLQPRTRGLRSLHGRERRRGAEDRRRMPSAPDPAGHDDAGDGRSADLPCDPRQPAPEGHDGGFPLGAGRGGAAVGGLRRRSRRLPDQAHQDETAGEPRSSSGSTPTKPPKRPRRRVSPSTASVIPSSATGRRSPCRARSSHCSTCSTRRPGN